MVKRILVLVEGQTEENFVKRILSSYFFAKNIYLKPTIITTKRVLRGIDHKGGVNSYKQVRNDLFPLLNDSSADIITTMIDYYALPSDFPGYNNRPNSSCYKRVEFMENEFSKNIDNHKFVAYMQLHEFESLVFANYKKLADVFIDKSSKLRKVEEIYNSYNSPEEINENPESAPSKRLKNIFSNYQKVLYSQLVLENSNIDEIRNSCPRFNSWLRNLEG